MKKSFTPDEDQRRKQWQEVTEAVKRAALCTDYLDRAKGNTFVCPFCGSGTGQNKTGLHYYKSSNTVACFSHCAEPGKKSRKYDVIDLYAARFGTDTAEAIKDLARLHNIPLPAEKGAKKTAAAPAKEKPAPAEKAPENGQNEAQKAQTDFTAYYKECAARLGDPAALAYLQKRGISRDTAERFGLGFDPEADPAGKPGAPLGEPKRHPAPRLIVPQGKYCFVGRRTDGNPEFAKMNAAGGEAGLTYEEEALHGGGFIFITEGAFDALAIMEAAPVYAVALNSTGNAGAFIRTIEALPELPKWRKSGQAVPFIVCMDNDAAGRDAEAFLLRELQRLGAPCIASRLEALPGEDPNDILTKYGREEMQRRIIAATEAAEKAASSFTGPEDPAAPEQKKDALETFLEEIQSRKFEPISTGIKSIDSALYGGFMRRTLITLAAAPGAGKTAMAQWIFENMAAAGHDVLYINLEMDRAQLLARSISRIAWKRSGRAGSSLSALDILRAYEWTPAQHAQIMEAVAEYRERIAPHFVYNPDTLQGNEINHILAVMQGEVDRLKATGRPEPLICLDYLQIIAADASTTAEGIQLIIKALKDFAIRNNTVIFLITAQNRAANKAGISEMESGRDTSAIEYSGDLMLGLVYTAIENGETWTYYERDEHGEIMKNKDGSPKKVIKAYDLERIRELLRQAYETNTEPDPVCNRLTLKVLKNRFGAAERRANFIFDGEHGTFRQVEPEGRTDPNAPGNLGEWTQGSFPEISAAY